MMGLWNLEQGQNVFSTPEKLFKEIEKLFELLGNRQMPCKR